MTDFRSPPSMSGDISLYNGLMEEAKIRISTVERLLRDEESFAPRIREEMCYLQLRMLCEIIAVACLVAHGDIRGAAAIKLGKPHEIIRKMEILHADFYPKPINFKVEHNVLNLFEGPKDHLDKISLISLWNNSGDFLHRGSLKSIMKHERGLHCDFGKVRQWLDRIGKLLHCHLISSADKKSHYMIVLADAAKDGNVSIVTMVSG